MKITCHKSIWNFRGKDIGYLVIKKQRLWLNKLPATGHLSITSVVLWDQRSSWDEQIKQVDCSEERAPGDWETNAGTDVSMRRFSKLINFHKEAPYARSNGPSRSVLIFTLVNKKESSEDPTSEEMVKELKETVEWATNKIQEDLRA